MTPNKRVGATEKVAMMVNTQKRLTETKTLFTISETSLVHRCIPSARQQMIPAQTDMVLQGKQLLAQNMQPLHTRGRMGFVRPGSVLARLGKGSACCNTVASNLPILLVRQ